MNITELVSRLYIVNHTDRPSEDHIAEKREDGFYYIHPKLRKVKIYHAMQPTNPTPLKDFGVYVEVELGRLSGRLFGGSVAKYIDGRPRKWQGENTFSFRL